MAQLSGSFTRTNSEKTSWAEDDDDSDGGLEDYIAKNTDFYQNGKLRSEEVTPGIELQDKAISVVIEPGSQEEDANEVESGPELELGQIPEPVEEDHKLEIISTETIADHMTSMAESADDSSVLRRQGQPDEHLENEQKDMKGDFLGTTSIPEAEVLSPCTVPTAHVEVPQANHEATPSEELECSTSTYPATTSTSSDEDQSSQGSMQNSLVSSSTPLPTPPTSPSTTRIETQEDIPDHEIEKISNLMSEPVSEPIPEPDTVSETLALVPAEPVVGFSVTAEVEIGEVEEQPPVSSTSPKEENAEPIDTEATTESQVIMEEVISPSIQETEPVKKSWSQVDPQSSVSPEGLVEEYPELIKAETIEDQAIAKKVVLPSILQTEPPKTTWSQVAKIGDQQARELQKLELERKLEKQKELEKQRNLEIETELEIQSNIDTTLTPENKPEQLKQSAQVESHLGSSSSGEESEAEVHEKELVIQESSILEPDVDSETASVDSVDSMDSEDSIESQSSVQFPNSLEGTNESDMEDRGAVPVRMARALDSMTISSEEPSTQDPEPTFEQSQRNKRKMTKEARQRKRKTEKEKKKERARALNESASSEREIAEATPTADEEEVKYLSTGPVEQMENTGSMNNTPDDSTVQTPEPEVETAKTKKRKMTKEAKQRKRKNDNEKKKAKATSLEDSAGLEAATMKATLDALEPPKTNKKIYYWIIGLIILGVIIVLGFRQYPNNSSNKLTISKAWATIDLDAIDWNTVSRETLKNLPNLDDPKARERANEAFKQGALSEADITPERFFRLYQQFFLENEIEREGTLVEL